MAEKFAMLDVATLAQGDNVRFALTEIEELATDIRRRGVLQPIVVIPDESGDGAEVLIGHRRLAAAQHAGLDKIPCVLRPREPEVNRMLDQIAENVQRVNLTPLEEATCCKELADRGMTALQIGVQMQKSDTWVKNRIRLLTLPQCLQDAIHNGKVTATRALDLPEDAIRTREQVETLARHLNDGGLGAWWREYYEKRAPATAHNWQAFERPTPPKPPPEAKFSLTLHFGPDETKILDALVTASSVFTKKAHVVNAMLEQQMNAAQSEAQFGDGWELETLRYINGMTEAEVAAYDARPPPSPP